MRNVLIACLLCLLMLYLIPSPGCVNPPKDTVIVDDPAAGGPVLAWDKNHDGKPDQTVKTRPKIDPITGKQAVDPITGKPQVEIVLDEAGKPVMITDVVPGSGIYKTAEKVDSVAPSILTGAGAFIPGGIGAVLLGLGAAWRVSRFGRIISNTVMSIQFARQRLKDGGYVEALKLLDEAVSSGQLQATAAEIAKIKEKMGLPSVTDASPVSEPPAEATPVAIPAAK